jgi:hypothetical protein
MTSKAESNKAKTQERRLVMKIERSCAIAAAAKKIWEGLRVFCSLFLITAAVAAAGAVASSRVANQQGAAVSRPPRAAQKIAPWVMEHTANGQQAEFFAVLVDQADLSHAESLQTKAEKGRYVYDTLLDKSRTTQGPILQWLRERGLKHQSFYIVNAILVTGTREIAEALAARLDVARIEGNPLMHNHLPKPDPVASAPYLRRPETMNPGLLTRMRLMYGRWVTPARISSLVVRTLVFAGPIMR